MPADPIIIAEYTYPTTGRRFAARLVRRRRCGVSFGVRLVGPHDDYPDDGGHVWVYGSLGRVGFGFGIEGGDYAT